MSNSVGRKLKELREARGMTLVELSKASGKAASYLSDVERLVKNNVTVETLQDLARALGVRPAFLIEDEAISVVELARVVGVGLPPDIAEWLACPTAFRWIRLAQSLDKEAVPPEAVEGLIEVLKNLKSREG